MARVNDFEPNWRHAGNVAAKVGGDLVVLSNLPPEKKKRLWDGIQAHDPLLAAGMRDDLMVKALMAAFDGVFVLDAEDVERFCGER